MFRLLGILLVTCLSFFVIVKANAAQNKPLRIAVAANFTPVLEKLLPEFTKQTGIKTQVISSATGTLFLQIRHGAPFDVFLSADASRPQKLVSQQLALKQSLKTYAYGQLALYSASQTTPIALTALSEYIKSSQSRFAIANPKTAPYGYAAKAVLETLGIWHDIKNKLITGINVNQTFVQIRSQSVKAGLVANSQLVLNNLTGTVIPSSYHQAIEQQLVILQNSKKVTQAEKFSQYLLSPKVQKLIVSYGYASAKVLSKGSE